MSDNGNMEFVGISTVAYKVPDIEKAKEWYSKAFGVKPYFDKPFYAGFNINGYELGLQPLEEKERVEAGSTISYWAVSDIAKTFDRLIKIGATINEEPNNVGGVVVVASVKDPWGNPIGIIYNPEFKESSET